MISRRALIKMSAALAVSQSFRSANVPTARAQSVTDYKALVCVFLEGGNDSNNMVVPLNDSSYSKYLTQRKHLALTGSQLTPSVSSIDGLPYAFHSAAP